MGRAKKAARAGPVPLMENEHVKELLSIMEKNQLSTMKDMLEVIGYIDNMEQQLGAAVNELAAMRKELATMREETHPIKTALQNAVKAMEKNVAALRERLAELKQNVIEGCKNAVADFKEKGISALDNMARFFHLRPGLEAMRGTLDKAIREDDAVIAKIEAVSTEYHKAGRHLKNMGRAMLGKEAIEDITPPGKLAKALEAPMKTERRLFASMRKGVDKAVSRLEWLEDRAKPSIQKTMQVLNAQIAKAQKDAPAPERPRPSTAER